jgi:hypothetical protein
MPYKHTDIYDVSNELIQKPTDDFSPHCNKW